MRVSALAASAGAILALAAPLRAQMPLLLSGASQAAGVCGSANGVAVSTAPTTGLCAVGSPTAVSGTGPWTWSCIGSGGGSTASCSAPVVSASGTCVYGNHGLVRGRPKIVNHTLVAENNCPIRAATIHIDAPSDNGSFSSLYGNATWWSDMYNHGHFNAIRIAAYLEWGAGSARTDSQTIANVEAQLDTILNQASAIGMYVIICNFNFPGPNGTGGDPPDWSNGPYGNATFWAAIAPRYASNTNVIYELQNEPDSDSDIPGHVTGAYNQVRGLAPNTTPLIVNTFNCFTNLTTLQAETGIDFTSLAIDGFHNYCGTDINAVISDAQGTQSAGYPVVQTEFAFDYGYNANDWIVGFENAGLSWMLLTSGFTDSASGIMYYDDGSRPLNITWPKD